MKTNILIISVILVAFFGCSSNDENIPECFQSFIDFVNERTPRGATIDKFTFNGEVVFGFNTNIPDAQGAFVDESCKTICNSGGFDPSLSDCDEGFLENLIFVETVWKDTRAR
ncbi:MAG: hypothetical protein CVT96_09855 [Bacteroidetes bacterium HGW-Bacteroidetes-13]|nr:MAG: hypothetical protein CVT96_09855 [Bacteroidetes bacterium HGW-Bacteroidetes-13]